MALVRILRDANNGDLLAELWTIIFQNLEPIFLNSIFRTSKEFNAIASSNAVFNHFLARYYPGQLTTRSEGYSYTFFKKCYMNDREGLTSSAGNLLDLIAFTDLIKIQSYQFNPDVLFEIDRHGKFVLSYLNKKHNQPLRDAVFNKVHAWFETNAKECAHWNNLPFSFIFNYYENEVIFNHKTEEGFTLLDFAIALNQTSLVVQNETPPFSPYPTNKLMLQHFQIACLFGHLDIVKHMLATGNPLDSPFSSSDHPLTCAIKQNQLEIAEFILVSQNNYIVSEVLREAIYYALYDDHLEILNLLLAKVNDVWEYIYDENNLLHLACMRGQPESATLISETFPELLDEVDTNEYLVDSAEAGCSKLIEFFLPQVENIAEYLQDNPYIFMLAVKSGNIESIQTLLTVGADPNIPADSEYALHVAASLNDIEAIKILLASGSDLSIQDSNGRTAFDIAKSKKLYSITRFLMESQWDAHLKRKAEVAPHR